MFLLIFISATLLLLECKYFNNLDNAKQAEFAYKASRPMQQKNGEEEFISCTS